MRPPTARRNSIKVYMSSLFTATEIFHKTSCVVINLTDSISSGNSAFKENIGRSLVRKT